MFINVSIKKLLIIFFLLCLPPIIASCTQGEGHGGVEINTNLKHQEKEHAFLYEESYIYIDIDETSITQSGMSFLIANRSNYLIMFGASFSLHTHSDGNWSEILPIRDLDFTLERSELSPGSVISLYVDWSAYYGDLHEGVYRFTKPFWFLPGFYEFSISCEFTIR